MPNANVVGLQNAVNRIAGLGRFTRVAVDGEMGPNTAQGTLAALGWVADNAPDSDTRSSAGQLVAALVNADGSLNLAQISSSASGLATFLNKTADAMGAPQENAQPVASSGGGAVLPASGSLMPGWATNISAAFKNLPTWQKAALGVGTAVAAIVIVSKIKHHRRAA